MEVLKEIREVEIEAEGIKKDALSQAKEIIRNANDEANIEFQSSQKEAQQLASRIISEKEEEARERAKVIMEASKRECEDVKAVSQEKIDRAVNLVIERIVRPHGDS